MSQKVDYHRPSLTCHVDEYTNDRLAWASSSQIAHEALKTIFSLYPDSGTPNANFTRVFKTQRCGLTFDVAVQLKTPSQRLCLRAS